ncbi:hypothetical protein CYMTET_29790 [Cymbomonas tetramitiformis]|uniref:BZIP domain-containing protein n=1 Tax=Cymbomonas tetramitiformis TaxID=36881 RepID=A0AAE0FKC6_9CHLO|nr:hypothetical protein CYMTET_29790 [Cymbomonas tetramitiformis]
MERTGTIGELDRNFTLTTLPSFTLDFTIQDLQTDKGLQKTGTLEQMKVEDFVEGLKNMANDNIGTISEPNPTCSARDSTSVVQPPQALPSASGASPEVTATQAGSAATISSPAVAPPHTEVSIPDDQRGKTMLEIWQNIQETKPAQAAEKEAEPFGNVRVKHLLNALAKGTEAQMDTIEEEEEDEGPPAEAVGEAAVEDGAGAGADADADVDADADDGDDGGEGQSCTPEEKDPSRAGKARGKRKQPEPQDDKVARIQKRMVKNRESAARSRARKQAYTSELEQEVAQLKQQNKKILEKVIATGAAPLTRQERMDLRRTRTNPI